MSILAQNICISFDISYLWVFLCRGVYIHSHWCLISRWTKYYSFRTQFLRSFMSQCCPRLTVYTKVVVLEQLVKKAVIFQVKCLLALQSLRKARCYPQKFTIDHDRIYTYNYTKKIKGTNYDLILWYASSGKFPIRTFNKSCVSCGETFILALIFGWLYVPVGSASAASVQFCCFRWICYRVLDYRKSRPFHQYYRAFHDASQGGLIVVKA